MKSRSRDQSSSDSRELDRSYDPLTGDPVSKPQQKSLKQRLLRLLPCYGSSSSSSSSQRNAAAAAADADLSLASYRPEGLDHLVQLTDFSRRELQVLYRGFKNECPSGVVNEDGFKRIYSQFFPQGDSSMYAHFLFQAFDTNDSGSVSFEDFSVSLSILLRGCVAEKLRWVFNLYDINRDGCISREEMTDIVRSIYDMMGASSHPHRRDSVAREHVHLFFQKMDRNDDGVVTFQEFLETCQKDENLMRSMRMFDYVA